MSVTQETKLRGPEISKCASAELERVLTIFKFDMSFGLLPRFCTLFTLCTGGPLIDRILALSLRKLGQFLALSKFIHEGKFGNGRL